MAESYDMSTKQPHTWFICSFSFSFWLLTSCYRDMRILRVNKTTSVCLSFCPLGLEMFRELLMSLGLISVQHLFYNKMILYASRDQFHPQWTAPGLMSGMDRYGCWYHVSVWCCAHSLLHTLIPGVCALCDVSLVYVVTLKKKNKTHIKNTWNFTINDANCIKTNSNIKQHEAFIWSLETFKKHEFHF